jgi:hypothetical protein
MKRFAFLIGLIGLGASAAQATLVRDKLGGFNGIAFGTTIAAAKLKLGAAVRADTDPSDPKIMTLLGNADLFGERFSVNYAFGDKGRFSESDATDRITTGDWVPCLAHWTNLLGQLKAKYGTPDSDSAMNPRVQLQELSFKFADGAKINANVMGCLIMLNFQAPNAAK